MDPFNKEKQQTTQKTKTLAIPAMIIIGMGGLFSIILSIGSAAGPYLGCGAGVRIPNPCDAYSEAEFQSCFDQPPIGICAKYDTDNNGVIGLQDFAKVNQIITSCDISCEDYTETGLQNCFGRPPIGICTKYDINDDGVISLPDFAEVGEIINTCNIQSLSDTVAHYTLDGSAQDSSVNGYHGTITGAVFDTGVSNQALRFNGASDYVDLGDFDVPGNELTLSAWVNPDTFDNEDDRIISKAVGSEEQDHYFMISTYGSGTTNRQLRFRLKAGGTTSTLITPAAVFSSNKWTHITAVFDGAQMLLYTDAQLVANTTKSGSLSTDPTAKVRLGQNPDGKGSFGGLIDEVHILDRALSVIEIQSLMDEDTVPPPIDTTSPIVANMNAIFISELNDVDINWEVYDNQPGDKGLDRIEIWRSTDGINFSEVTALRQTLSGAPGSHIGSTVDSPPLGTYWYGLHGVDVAGNVSVEPSPIQVVVTGGGGSLSTYSCSSVSHNVGGTIISWTFSETETCWNFANGGVGVLGPVTITAMTPTPDFSNNRDMYEINPSEGGSNSLDDRISGFTGDPPPLPHTTLGNESIVKVASRPNCVTPGQFNCLEAAAVLTVLTSLPDSNDYFRPPYMGSAKPLISSTGLRMDLLPSLAPAGTDIPTLQEIENRWRWVQIDYRAEDAARQMIASQNVNAPWNGGIQDYGAAISAGVGDGVLRVMLNDSISAKTDAVIALTQAGIDYYYAVMLPTGPSWFSTGGLNQGRALLPTFAATMLDNATMKSNLATLHGRNDCAQGGDGPGRTHNTFQEDGQFCYSPIANGGAGQVLWGDRDNFWSESLYWNYINNGIGGQQHQDPYGYIDGGLPGDSTNYQKCCTSESYVGMALTLLLMPEMQTSFDNSDFITYVDRWKTHGKWFAPDPEQNNANDIKNRRQEVFDGWDLGSGGYGSNFSSGMWNAYRTIARNNPATHLAVLGATTDIPEPFYTLPLINRIASKIIEIFITIFN